MHRALAFALVVFVVSCGLIACEDATDTSNLDANSETGTGHDTATQMNTATHADTVTQTDTATQPDTVTQADTATQSDTVTQADTHVPRRRNCVKGCNANSDCAVDGGQFSADNYECQSGACEFLGCRSDAECVTSIGVGYVCPTTAGTLRSCVKRCNANSDCAVDGGQFSADNYECQSGACEFLGCRSDAECVTSIGVGYVCPTTGGTLRSCVRGCNANSECAVDGGQFSADNYECQSGACEFLGCHSDAECVTSIGAGYVCPD